MTVTGRVIAGGTAVGGATVSIAELGLQSRTNEDGRYSFIVRASDVRGQAVTLVARHRRYGTQEARIFLAGGSIQQDFVFTLDAPRRAPAGGPLDTTWVGARALGDLSRSIDSSALTEAAGPLDVGSALAGRFPGLTVIGATALGGSSPMFFRGPRSIVGDNQPLVVVDGIPVGTSSFASPSQRFGLGGFDYGSPLADLTLADIASITLVSGPPATARFGSRAANGVLLVATKRGGGLDGLFVSANTRFTLERATRLPSYQNVYGQGLGGQFEFFDGSGGGINDDVEQSWGPKLEGQPVIQASLIEPRRPDVRPWLPQPAAISGYFGGARTIDATIAVAGGIPASAMGFRAALNARTAKGLTPGAKQDRLGLTLSGVASPTTRLDAEAHVRLVGTRAFDRPGTGFDEINPVSGFSRMGRQVDLPALRTRIRDTVEQINWIYTARNNPYFQSVENSNDDHRGHIIAAATARYRITDWLDAVVSGGTDNYHESRNFQVAPGWKGGYPTALGRGDFSGGGQQRQKISLAERLASLSLDARSALAPGWSIAGAAGVDVRRNIFEMTVDVRDSAIGTPAAVSALFDADAFDVTSIHVSGSLSRGEILAVNGGLRREQGASLPAPSSASAASAVFPSLSVTYDAAGQFASLRRLGVGTARLRAGWWRAGNEITARALASTYVRRASPGDLTTGVRLERLSGPERTTGLEIGAEVASGARRVVLDVVSYSERSSDVVVPLVAASVDTGLQTAVITNVGYEARLTASPFRNPAGLGWDVTLGLARNRNRVESIASGVEELALSPSLWGASLTARAGEPLGTIVGTRYLRDPASRALLLSNGLPVPDATAGLTVFGSWQPDWTGSVATSVRYRAVELAVLVDARIGGKVFSATNMWGSYAGTLVSTLVGRDTGLLVAGLDSVTGAPNTIRVSAEDYFHSLAAIHEAWIFDAGYTRLREARFTVELPLTFVPTLRQQTARLSIIGRNLLTRTDAPNMDPESALSAGAFQGFEMGQLPGARSIGMAVTITP